MSTFVETIRGVPLIHTFFDPVTSTWTYVVVDASTLKACVIDPVLEYDATTNVACADELHRLAEFIENKGYCVERIIETHVHADHLSGAAVLKEILSCSSQTFIGENVNLVQNALGSQYGFDSASFQGSFDGFLRNDESWHLGGLNSRNLAAPGHTPDGMAIAIGNAVFVGDSLLPPEVGTARCDFPGGSADILWESVQRLLHLHGDIKVFSAHDYPGVEREKRSYATVADHKLNNIHVKDGSDPITFMRFRGARDATLAPPKLIEQALRVNLRGGRLSGGVTLKSSR